MKVYKKLNHNPYLALALGFFDGVHLAHKKLITTVVKYAQDNETESAIITFQKNPAIYFSQNNVPNIISNEEKLERFEMLKVDNVYMLDFEEFMHLSAYSYLKDVIVENFEPRCIVTGFNHTFGRNKEGNPKFLAKYSAEFGYDYIELPVQKIETCLISSTNIRQMIQKGHVKDANRLLGRPFALKNNVIKGNMLARKLGYPTANIHWPNNIVNLANGVYFGYVVVDKTYPALINWGTRPTVANEEQKVLEAHIFNFDAQIYGKIIKVIFALKIREEIKFPNLEALKKQIAKDVDTIKDMI